MKIAIITGTRNPVTATQADEIKKIVNAAFIRGYNIYFGDYRGVDAAVYDYCAKQAKEIEHPKFYKQFIPLKSLGHSAAGLAERSTRIVKTAINDSHGDQIVCIGFPSTDCPDTITPARTWKSGRSGTWSTMALAQGHQVETWLFNTIHHPTGTAWCGTWRREMFFDVVEGYRYYDVNNEFAFFPDTATEQLYREE